MAVASLALILGSSVLAAALPAQVPLAVGFADTCIPVGTAKVGGEYCGTDITCNGNTPTMLRISNGGAGLSGLVGYLANNFIDSEIKRSSTERFKIQWIKGDTTETLGYLGTGQADVGITYNKAAECQALNDGVAVRREYGFRDHFYLVGPKVDKNNTNYKKYKYFNPAELQPMKEDILEQFQKIVRTGNEERTPPTRFLSRYDKSATNIKDSELFVRIGQVPWGLAYSKWYHQYTMYPIDALTAAALLQEYTITDRGTWLSTDKAYRKKLTIYNQGSDDNPTDPLLNPAFFLTSSKSCQERNTMANSFLNWTISDVGQKAIADFRKEGKEGPDDWLYTSAPTGPHQAIKDCKA